MSVRIQDPCSRPSTAPPSAPASTSERTHPPVPFSSSGSFGSEGSGLTQRWDFPAGEVRVSTDGLPRSGPGIVPMARYDRPIIQARIAGRTLPVMVDTGLSGTLSLEDFDRLPHLGCARVVDTRVRVDGVHPVRVARFGGEVALEDLVVGRPLIRDAVEGSLPGTELLRRLVVTLDRTVGTTILVP